MATSSKSFSVAVVTISDSRSAGTRVDTAGPTLTRMLEERGFEVHVRDIVPDDLEAITELLSDLCERAEINLILTTGGTGLSPRDVTPQATRSLGGYEVPGIGECLRAYGSRHTPRAWLSRGIGLVHRGKLIVNLPGSEKGVREGVEALAPFLEHALETLVGATRECGAS